MSSVVCCTDDEAFLRFHCPIEVLIDNKWQFMSRISDVHQKKRIENQYINNFEQMFICNFSCTSMCSATFEQMFTVSLSFPAGCY